MQKLRKGDTVVVRSGKDKGKSGNVMRILENGMSVLVEGINLARKHVKPNPNAGVEGGIKEVERPLRACKVGLQNPATKRADKVGFKVLEDGRKVRYFKSNDEIVDIIES